MQQRLVQAVLAFSTVLLLACSSEEVREEPKAVSALTAPAVSSSFEQAAAAQLQVSSEQPCLEGFPCFRQSNAFPALLPPVEAYPWLSHDFQTHAPAYMSAVLDYVFEGNTEVDWVLQDNKVRAWFHAPWMHLGSRGREPLHGLTRERGSRWHELGPAQVRRTNNWAVGFYNARGAYSIGQMWAAPGAPDSSKAQFPVGTVSAKLLFTDATDLEAPFLSSPAQLEWAAKIDRQSPTPTVLRLLQLDVAVRDSRADGFTGWLFGTFVFDNSSGGATYRDNLVPVSLQWGNDPGFTDSDYRSGARPVEGWVSPEILGKFTHRPPEGDFGYLGRANGPVDSPFSSCLGCHGRAVDTRGGPGPAFTPRRSDICMRQFEIDGNQSYERIGGCEVDETAVSVFFRNFKPHEPFLKDAVSLDYSLQLADGLSRWHDWFEDAFPDLYQERFPGPEVELLSAAQDSALPSVFDVASPIPTISRSRAFSRDDGD